jgi:hypothetical protein
MSNDVRAPDYTKPGAYPADLSPELRFPKLRVSVTSPLPDPLACGVRYYIGCTLRDEVNVTCDANQVDRLYTAATYHLARRARRVNCPDECGPLRTWIDYYHVWCAAAARCDFDLRMGLICPTENDIVPPGVSPPHLDADDVVPRDGLTEGEWGAGVSEFVFVDSPGVVSMQCPSAQVLDCEHVRIGCPCTITDYEPYVREARRDIKARCRDFTCGTAGQRCRLVLTEWAFKWALERDAVTGRCNVRVWLTIQVNCTDL